MRVEKVKKIVFTMICVLLISAIGVVTFAAWDDISNKKNSFDVGVGGAAEMSVTIDSANTLATDKLMPFGATISSGTAVTSLKAKFTIKVTPTAKYNLMYQGISLLTMDGKDQLVNADGITTEGADATPIMVKVVRATLADNPTHAVLKAATTLPKGAITITSDRNVASTHDFFVYIYFAKDLSLDDAAGGSTIKTVYNDFIKKAISLKLNFQLVSV